MKKVKAMDENTEKDQEVPSEVDEYYKFPVPSEEEATFLLRELNWGEHFVGMEMNPTAGNQDIYMYSLREVLRFLKHGTAGMGLSSGGKGAINWLNIDPFVVWVRDALKDKELADELEKELATEEFFYGKIQIVGHLVNSRYAQLCEVLNKEEEAEEAEAAEGDTEA